jgi:hypothetical protein
MTIREAVRRDRLSASSATVSPSNLTISVKTKRQLIGETWYDPTVAVTNVSPTEATISAVELATKGIVYANKHKAAYPLVVLSGQTATLDVEFDLREDVWKTFFKQPAELRVNYVSDGQQKTAHASIIGDSKFP